MRKVVVAVTLLCLPAFGQRHKLESIDASTPEGQELQAIGTEQDPAARTALLEKFAAAHPKHPAYGWVLSQSQAAHSKAGNHDAVLAAGEKLIALDPDDLEAAYAALKAAEKKGDSDAVLRWSLAASAAARKVPDGDAKPFAKQVDVYTEYAVFSAVLGSQDPNKTMALAEGLERLNPASQYMPQVLGRYAAAARQANAMDKAAALAERTLSRGTANDDMLLLLSDYTLTQKQFDKSVAYSGKLIELLTGPKPESIEDAAWENKRNAALGLAYWIQGTAYSSQEKFLSADKALRQALPLVKDNPQLLAGATFHLGLANYRMAKGAKNPKLVLDALRFSEQSAAIKSPFQEQARRNVKVIRTEYRVK